MDTLLLRLVQWFFGFLGALMMAAAGAYFMYAFQSDNGLKSFGSLTASGALIGSSAVMLMTSILAYIARHQRMMRRETAFGLGRLESSLQQPTQPYR